jgi:hypothetical protein
MAFFQRNLPRNLVQIHPHNVSNKDWVIMLEAGTIVGRSPERFRVARATLERKVVTKRHIFSGPKHYLFIEGYDSRIHGVYFCPQLYAYDPDKMLVPLSGDEIGRLIGHALEGAIRQRRPWYQPSEPLPDEPIINAPMQSEFDTLVVDTPVMREATRTSRFASSVAQLPAPTSGIKQ